MMKVVKAKKLKIPEPRRKNGMVCIGFDLSLSSLAGCIRFEDALLNRINQPRWSITRWPKDEYTQDDKLEVVAKAHDFVHTLLHKAKAFVELDEIFIGIEEVPISKFKQAKRIREQSEIVGCFVGGLRRYGFKNIQRVNPKSWQACVARDFDLKANKDFDKWAVKEWAIEVYGAPSWRDLIYNNKKGLIPKPKTSVAQPVQPDDRFDSTGIMQLVWDQAHKTKR